MRWRFCKLIPRRDSAVMGIPLSDLTFDEFVYLRDEIRGHHEIINHRMSWFAATQSLLYGAYATAAAAAAAAAATATATDKMELKYFSSYLIPVVGIILCILMVFSVESAIERIEALRRVLKANRIVRHKRIYPINSDLMHGAALLYPRLATIVFLVSWGFLLSH